MDFNLTEEQSLLRDSVRRMMNDIVTPDYIREHDQKCLYPYEAYEKWVEMGLLSLPFPEEYGGAGGDLIDMVLVGEELGRKGFDFLGAYGVPLFNGLNILRNGNEQQKNEYR